MKPADALARLAMCRANQPQERQVIVAGEIVDALLCMGRPSTGTHWQQASVWLGWRTASQVRLVVALWTPHGQDAAGWADRLTALRDNG